MKTLSTAISALALFASNLAGQVTVTRTPLRGMPYTMEFRVCGHIRDFHLRLHHSRPTLKFDANVRPVALNGWKSKKAGTPPRELVWTLNPNQPSTVGCKVFKVNVGVTSAVTNFDDVYWVTTKTGLGVVHWDDKQVKNAAECRQDISVKFTRTPVANSNPKMVEFKYTVSTNPNIPKVCDFHVRSLKGKINGKGQEIKDAKGNPTWKMVQRGRMISWYFLGDCNKAKLTQEFKVLVPAGAKLDKALWFATGAGMPKRGRPQLRLADVLELGTLESRVGNKEVLIAYRDDGLDVTPLKFSRIGEATPIAVSAPSYIGRDYFLAAAFDISQGIRLPTGAQLRQRHWAKEWRRRAAGWMRPCTVGRSPAPGRLGSRRGGSRWQAPWTKPTTRRSRRWPQSRRGSTGRSTPWRTMGWNRIQRNARIRARSRR